MTLQAGRATRSRRGSGAIAAGAALVGLSTLGAHQATYLTTSGSAAAYAEAMSSTGHDATWLPLVTIVLIASAILTAVATRRLLRLGGLAQRSVSPIATPSLDAYGQVVLGLWGRTTAATFLAYAILENAERALAELALPGIDALVIHGPLPVLLIVASSFVVAAVAGLVRWRTSALLARIGTGPVGRWRPTAFRPPIEPARRPARPWTVRSPSRAPPALLPAA